MDKLSGKTQKTSFLGHFGLIWAHLAQFGHNEIFFEKSGSVTFLPLWSPNFMQEIRKIFRANFSNFALLTD